MGTVTTGAESGTTRSRSWGTSPSSGVPSAAVRSASHVPEADGGAASRPEKRPPSTARRARAAGSVSRRHAAAASATLAVPLVRITVPSGIATGSGPGTSGSSGRARYSGYRAVSSRPARNAGSATLTRRSTQRRLPLEARRYRSDSMGPTRRAARPSESSAIDTARPGSPAPRASAARPTGPRAPPGAGRGPHPPPPAPRAGPGGGRRRPPPGGGGGGAPPPAQDPPRGARCPRDQEPPHPPRRDARRERQP